MPDSLRTGTGNPALVTVKVLYCPGSTRRLAALVITGAVPIVTPRTSATIDMEYLPGAGLIAPLMLIDRLSPAGTVRLAMRTTSLLPAPETTVGTKDNELSVRSATTYADEGAGNSVPAGALSSMVALPAAIGALACSPLMV